MENNNCHMVLKNFKVSDFISNVNDIPRIEYDKPFGVISTNPINFLKTKMYNKLLVLGNLTCLIFEMKPNVDKRSIHIDIDYSTKKPYWPSLNIIIKGQGVMKWFNPATEGKIYYNKDGKVFYKAWFSDYGSIVDEWSTEKIAIVRTDVPHQVWNYDEEPRLMVSIRWSNRTSWEETKEFFSNLTID